MNTNQAVGRAVHQVLWDRRLRQIDLCDALGLSRQSVSQKLRGERPWSVDELLATARYLEVPVTELLPRLDSNQEPAGQRWGRVVAFPGVAHATAA